MSTDTATALQRLRGVVRLRRTPVCDHPSADATEVLELLGRFGRNSASFVVSYPAPWRRFLGTDVEGAACYLEARRTAVFWADPLCRNDDTPRLLEELTSSMRRARRRVCLVPITVPVAEAATQLGLGVMKIGEEPLFELGGWRLPRGRAGKTLRGHLNRARRAGIEVIEYRPARGRDPLLEEQLLDAQESWAGERQERLVNSVLMPAPLHRIEAKRYFCALRRGRVEAFASCVPVHELRGWLLEDLTRRPDAAAGATELLTVEALGHLADDGARMASLGLAPGRGVDVQPYTPMAPLSPLLRWTLARLARHYEFDAIAAWNAKFRPSAWEPRFVAFSPRWPTPGLVLGALAALGLGGG